MRQTLPVQAGQWLRAEVMGGRTMADIDLSAAELIPTATTLPTTSAARR